MKPGAAAPLTATVPGNPEMALIAAVRLALLYGRPEPPTTAESLPLIRTWNGEKYVAVPPPPFGCWEAMVYWNVVGLGTAVIANVPL